MSHLPQCFDEGQVEVKRLVQAQTALIWLAKQIFGPGSTPEDLVDHLNGSDLLEEYPISPSGLTRMREFSRKLAIGVPNKFTMCPVNSVAVLLHWRVVGNLLNLLTEEQRDRFKALHSLGLVPQLQSLASVTSPKEVGPTALVTAKPLFRQEEAEEGPMEAETQPEMPSPAMEQGLDVLVLDEGASEFDGQSLAGPISPQAIDAHCHLDRLQLRQFGKYLESRSLEDTLKPGPQQHPDRSFQLVSVVSVHCDPGTYPKVTGQDTRIHHAIGLHPKKADQFNQAIKEKICHLLKQPQVVALGEIGIDQSTPPASWVRQREVFQSLLKLKPSGLPVVVHCRGNAMDEKKNFGAVAHCLAIGILDRHCQESKANSVSDMAIHVHCFRGDYQVLEAWLVKFPRAYFGFSGMVARFTSQQKRALRRVPEDRLLLETDAPYLSPRNNRISTPNDIGEVAHLVSRIRGTTVESVLATTTANSQALYHF
ncbi:uncharacterized metal-dependent hydrolase YcfH-like [Haliotis cracherodii]|uniref:uncharacterized metal-dependent hydrolase YcfH-like n=1 Tax=Haliotis cracherodii TaxID=6455 RepID=UPI0039EBD697